jgi:FKBP-type peptidyl-prolyl cis-trans isomerase FkpA
MKPWMIIVALVIIVGAVVAYTMTRKSAQEQTATTVPAAQAPAQPATMANPQKQFLVENGKREGWKTTPSGLQYFVEKAADQTQPMPTATSEVTVNYEGKLIDGTVFDSSYARNEPATFPLNGVIPGWTEGVALMRKGDVFNFAIPSELAYGDRPVGPIPPGSTLLFKVELLDFKP